MIPAKQKQKYARKLKQNQTKTERLMWPLWFVGFKPQVITPCGYIADYYNARSRIVVEIDGGVHKILKERDRGRDKHHRNKGIFTIRVSDRHVADHRVLTLTKIIFLGTLWQLYRWFRI